MLNWIIYLGCFVAVLCAALWRTAARAFGGK
jgi:hypothetical protein